MQSFIYGLRKRDFIGDADIIAWMDAGMQPEPAPKAASASALPLVLPKLSERAAGMSEHILLRSLVIPFL